jgi:preprotein translocase subunit SecA
MSSSALLRPGIALGAYPQQQDIRDSWLDRMSSSIIGRIRQRVYGRHPRYAGLVDRINRQAQGLDRISDDEFRRCVTEVRKNLYAEGFRDDLVARSFALTREAATRCVDMRHFDVQLLGGSVMLQGMIAEMETGEGKTLTATLPAATAAFAGIPVHIVTVNDFLVTRDAEWMGPVYTMLGLSVGTITEGMSVDERRAAYDCDITYCTNKQLVFDYLKDKLLLSQESRPLHLRIEGLYAARPRTSQLMMRGLCFAIVDEADSVLIDEARTPLIISNSTNMADQETTYRNAIRIGRQLISPRDYSIRSQRRQIELTELGKAHLARLSQSLGGVWANKKTREELANQALSALHLYKQNKQYLVQDERIQIIDEYTGRVMSDRSWERGLHQMIETKEECPISGRQETLARISYQRFFRRYLRVGGMTGTAREVARELWSVYRLNVVTVPTNRPTRRTGFRDDIYPTADLKWRAIVRRVSELNQECNNPILIGTRSVAASEHLSELLDRARIPHCVLNARQDQEEATVIAEAGELGRVTVATNMAGRGTDIRLGPMVADLGGLFVLATERHEARRIDRQLFGRCARQGDAGIYQAIISTEDELIEEFYGASLKPLVMGWAKRGKPLPRWLGAIILSGAQTAAEFRHSRTRQKLLKIDDNIGDMLAFSGRGE